jgi:hypothetical protein
MDVGTDDWDAMVSIIEDYEDYYETTMVTVQGYRDQLYDEERGEEEIKGIIDDIYDELKALDYRWVEDAFACGEYIDETAWDNYVDWVDDKRGGDVGGDGE